MPGIPDHLTAALADQYRIERELGAGGMEADFDVLTALENWVERGQPPRSILMTRHASDGTPLWSRPVCAYPERARLRGGDPAAAASFACEAP